MLKQFLVLVCVVIASSAQTPVLTGLTPAAVSAGSSATSLTLHGTGFMAGSGVRLGARLLTPSSLTATQMQVLLPAADLASARIHLVRVESAAGATSAALPLPVLGESLAAGSWHSIGIDCNGGLFAWGSNFSGQLGIGSTTNTAYPTRVMGITALAVEGGQGHTLVLATDATLRVTGYNASGQLGLGNTTSRTSFVAVPQVTGAVGVAAGGTHSLALLANGTVLASGENGSGQLGLGDSTDRTSFTLIPALTEVVAISAGENHSLALLRSGAVRSWGLNNVGQLGLGDTTARSSPTAITGLGNVVAVAAGGWHSFALKADGTVAAWGANVSGQLGLADTTNRTAPTALALTNVSAVTAGEYHSLLLQAGALFTTGDNTSGQLGLNDYMNRANFTPASAQGARALAGGTAHSAVIGPFGIPWLAGHNTYGQLGDGTFLVHPTLLPALYLDLTPVLLGLAATPPTTFSVSVNGALEHAGHTYLNAFSADTLNATAAYQGPWFGLFITHDDLLFQIGIAAPPFVGTLNALGDAGSSIALPLGSLAGLQLFGLTTTWDLNAGIYTGYSAIAAHTF